MRTTYRPLWIARAWKHPYDQSCGHGRDLRGCRRGLGIRLRSVVRGLTGPDECKYGLYDFPRVIGLYGFPLEKSIIPRPNETYGWSQARNTWRAYSGQCTPYEISLIKCCGRFTGFLHVLRPQNGKILYVQPTSSVRFACGHRMGPCG